MQYKVFMNSVSSFRRLLCNLPEFYQIQLRSRRRGRPGTPIYGHWNWDISTVYRILFRFRPGRRGTAGAVKSGASRPPGAKHPKYTKEISENMNSFYKPFLVYWTMSRFPPRDCRSRNRTNRRKRHEEKYSRPRQPLRIQGNASAPAVDPPPGTPARTGRVRGQPDAADDPLRHLRRPPPLSIFSPGDKMGAGFPGGRATVRRQACLL